MENIFRHIFKRIECNWLPLNHSTEKLTSELIILPGDLIERLEARIKVLKTW